MEIVFFFSLLTRKFELSWKFDCRYHYRQVNIILCSHLVNNCELVALDKNSATMLHSLNGIQSNSTCNI